MPTWTGHEEANSRFSQVCESAQKTLFVEDSPSCLYSCVKSPKNAGLGFTKIYNLNMIITAHLSPCVPSFYTYQINPLAMKMDI